jgi:hypothetical protein
MSTTQTEVPAPTAAPAAAAAKKPAFSLDASEQQLLDEFGVLTFAAEYTYGA